MAEINEAIDKAPLSSSLNGLSHVSDPSDDIVEVLIQCMKWNMATRARSIRESELPDLHQDAVDLLDLLRTTLPEKCGEKSGWNFEKAHSILHKVRDIVMWGNSDNTSCQGPEHAHIDLIKAIAECTNNKDVFMCILRFHARKGYLQHYESILKELEGHPDQPSKSSAPQDSYARDSAQLGDHNFNVACETGLRYPTLQAMLNRNAMKLRITVRSWFIHHGKILVYT